VIIDLRFTVRITFAASFLACGVLQAQQIGMPITPTPADPAIAAALQQVSVEHIRATIEKLVSFNNRSTLSSMETDLPPGTGVSAAADWIESEFKRISADCGGCLEVKRDDFIEPPQPGPASRILKPTKLTNVYAILHGTDPAGPPQDPRYRPLRLPQLRQLQHPRPRPRRER